jgi:hypothetical protein
LSKILNTSTTSSLNSLVNSYRILIFYQLLFMYFFMYAGWTLVYSIYDDVMLHFLG